MKTLEQSSTTLHVFAPPGQTGVATDDSLAVAAKKRETNSQGWQRVIDSTLIEWGCDPSQLEDEGVTAPARSIIDRANELAMILRDDGRVPPPKRVVTSPDGGVVFERWDGPVLEQIEVTENGEILLACFEHSRLAHMGPLHLTP